MDFYNSSKFSNIDALRGLGVGMVLLYHTMHPYFSKFYLGVDLFFVLSGFLIFRTIIFSKMHNTFDLLFTTNAALRVAPALVFVAAENMIFDIFF